MSARVLLKRLGWIGGAGAVYHSMLRPRLLHWGATAEEARRVLPGDDVSPPTPLRSTMAITIDSPPEAIWPWLVQMGWGRGGFYSYNSLETAFGLDLHNADRIHPEWQNLAVGDTVLMSHPRLNRALPETRVVTLDPNRALVLAILPPEHVGSDVPGGTWSFVLDPIDSESTRLIVRLQVHPPKLSGQLYIYLLMEPAHFVMQRGGLRGIKRRVERYTYYKPTPSAPPQPLTM